MQVNLVAVGNKMPSWVNHGFLEYQKRLPAEFTLNLIEISPEKHTKNLSSAVIKAREGGRIINAIKKLNKQNVVALEVTGKPWSTESLACEIKLWMEQGQNISLLIGGAEGLSGECQKLANTTRSLSSMTLPHYLVRVVVAEQLYRAWSLLNRHPYHRK